MILTNLSAVPRYERMRRPLLPALTDIEVVGEIELREMVEDDDGTHGLRIERQVRRAEKDDYRRRRMLLAPERRRWPRRDGGSNRQLGQIVDIDA